jgi:hypothetical protein
MSETTYVYENVNIGNDLIIYVDGNSKITMGNGTYLNPLPNAISLPHISTCPGATKSCLSTCYVFGLRERAPEVYAKYAENERILHKILMNDRLSESSAEMFAAWISDKCASGFRWHVSGDVMSQQHAKWITNVCDLSPTVIHWMYTRSIDLVPILIKSKNLSVNISADIDNLAEAQEMAMLFGCRLCYLTQDGSIPSCLSKDDIIFPDYPLRGRDPNPIDHVWYKQLPIEKKRLVCPADFFGQSEQHRCGPCFRCMERL